MPLSEFDKVKPWIPALNIGDIGNNAIKAIQASKGIGRLFIWYQVTTVKFTDPVLFA